LDREASVKEAESEATGRRTGTGYKASVKEAESEATGRRTGTEDKAPLRRASEPVIAKLS
jgi:hypothetical protein